MAGVFLSGAGFLSVPYNIVSTSERLAVAKTIHSISQVTPTEFDFVGGSVYYRWCCIYDALG